MIARFQPVLIIALVCGSVYANAESPIGGVLRVYSDELQGRTTASGELYEVSALTGAHESLPLGSMVRVANFETGKMVDVRINDRKRADSTLVHLSRAAASRIGLSGNQAARGSILVIGSMAPLPVTPAVSATPRAPLATADASARRRFAPFSRAPKDPMLKAVNEPGNAMAPASARTVPTERRGLFGGRNTVQYGIPASQYEPPVMVQNTGGGNNSNQGEIVPLSAGSQFPSHAGRSASPGSAANSGQVAAAAGNPFFRVQFGAFRRATNASEFNAGLIQSGIATTVLQSRANDLYLVVTSGGFPTAEDAQRWIHYEGTRRGWRERPVVIR